MKKLLITVLFLFHVYAFGIDPNLMYGLGSVKNVPIEYNPVIGLSFLKFGIITSWLESSDKDPVVRLTRLLFRVNGEALDAVAISYLTPETIGHIVKLIDDYKNNLDQFKQAVMDYFKTLPEFKDAFDIPKSETELLDLMVEAFRYVDATTVYPKGSVPTLLLGYLCAISNSRDDIQKYYQGFLNNRDFVLPSVEEISKNTKKSESAKKSESSEKRVYKNYFCSVKQSKELDSFINSFADKSNSYDALQNFVLLFFNFKDGHLLPNTTSSSLINYLDVADLGTMMRMIEQYKDEKELLVQLQDYLVGLRIRDRSTGDFLDEKSFRPLLIDVSESLQLTQGKNAKYQYKFFEDILDSCICSRLNSAYDIENYCKGLFVHVTDDLIDAKKKEFACCLSKKQPNKDDEKDEKEEAWELELEHEHKHGHEHERDVDGDESQDTKDEKEEPWKLELEQQQADQEYLDTDEEILDAIVERTVLFDYQKAQTENPVEAIIYELVKEKKLQEEKKEMSQDSSSLGQQQSALSQSTQPGQIPPVVPISVGGFYTMKKRDERRKALEQEAEGFKKLLRSLENQEGMVYQKIKIQKKEPEQKTKKIADNSPKQTVVAVGQGGISVLPPIPNIQEDEQLNIKKQQSDDSSLFPKVQVVVPSNDQDKQKEGEGQELPISGLSIKKNKDWSLRKSSTSKTAKRSQTQEKAESKKTSKSQAVVKPNNIPLKSGVTLVNFFGFIPTSPQQISQSSQPVVLSTGQTNVAAAVQGNNLLVPNNTPGVTCTHLQSTIGNFASALQNATGLKIIPEQDIHLMVDPPVAVRYFSRICKELDWKVDFSKFDLRKPFIVNTGQDNFIINFHVKRTMTMPKEGASKVEVVEDEPEESEIISLPAAEMKIGDVVKIPPQASYGSIISLNRSQVEAMPDVVVAAALAGFVSPQAAQQYKQFQKPWLQQLEAFGKNQQKSFEFTSIVTPKPYERVMSKINEIMSDEKSIKRNYVGYDLESFFTDSKSTYRQEITQEDINQYFEYAPAENIYSVFQKLNELPNSNRYELLNSPHFSQEALGMLFERMPTEELLKLFDYMSSEQKLNILKKIPQASFKKFVDDSTLQDIDKLATGMEGEDLKKLRNLKVSDTQTLNDVYFQRFRPSYQKSEMGEHLKYLTQHDLQNKNMQELEKLAQERQLAYEQWRRIPTLKPNESESSATAMSGDQKRYLTHTPIIYPVAGTKRFLQQGSFKHYLAERAPTVVRDVVRSGIHGLQ